MTPRKAFYTTESVIKSDWSKTIKRIDSAIRYEEPTRRCLICSRLENEKAKIVKEVGWICPECAKKIGILIGVRDVDLIQCEGESPRDV